MTEEGKRREREAEVADVLVAIHLLERLRDVYKDKIATSGTHQRADLKRSLWQIEQGCDRNDGVDERIWKVISRPEIAKFSLARPGLAVFTKHLRRLQGEQPVESSAT